MNNLKLSPTIPLPPEFAQRWVCRLFTLFCIVATTSGTAHANVSSLSYDANGNLTVVLPASVGAPVIINQPISRTVAVGGSSAFSVSASGGSGLTYQWKFNGSSIAGATSETLYLLSVSAASEGLYTVTVSNGAGSVTSQAVHLYLDADGDGMGDTWEASQFGNLLKTADEDTDGDGLTNAEEFVDGTNPASNVSWLVRLLVAADYGTVGVTPGSATGRYAVGTAVSLTPAALPGYIFHRWECDGLSTATTPLVITLNADTTVRAVYASSAGTATETADWTWESGSIAAWAAVASPNHDGADSIQSGLVPGTGTSWVSTLVSSNGGTLRFWWKCSAAATGAAILYVDGVESARIGGNADWQQVSRVLPRGVHHLQWNYTKTSGAVTGSDAAWIDQVSLGGEELSLAEALDNAAVSWRTGGTACWKGLGEVATSFDGVDAGQSGFVSHLQDSWAEMTVAGPVVTSFWMKVSSHATDKLTFALNGREVLNRSGEAAWERRQLVLGPGNQTLRWRYAKDFSLSAGADAVWLDQVSAVPWIPLETALDAGGSTFTTGGETGWAGVATPALAGGSAVQCGALASGERSWFETVMTGPAMVNFSAKSSCDAGDALEFSVDGTVLWTLSGEVDWTPKEFAVPGGNHTLRWRFKKNSAASTGQDAVWIDQYAVTPGLSLQEAVDSSLTGLTQTGNGGEWIGVSGASSHDGIDGIQTTILRDNQSAQLEMPVVGPGTLSYWFKASSQLNSDFLTVEVDTGFQRYSGEQDWRYFVWVIPAGTHTVRWRYQKDGGGSAGSDTAWLDQITYTPDPAPPLADAVDQVSPVPEWRSVGVDAWWRQTAESHDGQDAAQSGVLPDGRSSTLYRDYTGPGLLTFWWKVSSLLDSDILFFELDGIVVKSISGEIGWEKVEHFLGSGPHTVRWRYQKDSSGSAGMDAGWLDEVTFGQPPGSDLALAGDAPELPWMTGGIAEWEGVAAPSTDGTGAMQTGVVGNSQESWIETSIWGPGVLTYKWRVSSGAGDRLAVVIDGTERAFIQGEIDWTDQQWLLGDGSHTVRWRYSKDASGATGADLGWIDQVSFVPGLPLAEALDTPLSGWTTGATQAGQASWLGIKTSSHDTADGARSGDAGDGLETWMEVSVAGPGILGFWWKVSSQSGGDYLRLSLDGVDYASISGETAWERRTVSIAAGNHTVRWRYTKNATLSAGLDAGWVDEVQWTPDGGAQPTMAEAVDSPLEGWMTGGAGPWTPPAVSNSTLIPPGAVWKYHNLGQDLGTAWKTQSYNDASWASGAAELGAGDGQPLPINIGPAGARYPAIYFRKTFTVAAGAVFGSANLDIRRDDGAVVYLDGTEVARSNMNPTAAITYSSLASVGLDGNDELAYLPFTINPALLSPGSHTIAVEVHQASITSSDLRFDLGLTTSSGSAGHDAVDALKSAPVGHGQLTWTEISVPGPGTLTFWWRVSSEAGKDTLQLLMDDTGAASISGELPWEKRVVAVPPGIHRMRWVYAKDGAGTAGSDAGWLDQVHFHSEARRDLAEAVDTSLPGWHAGGTIPWTRIPDQPVPVVIVPQGSEWKYHNLGQDLGTAWRQPAYGDASWPSGPAQLGAGDSDEVTIIDLGPAAARFPTIYFRKAFEVAPGTEVLSATVEVVRDDGAVIYLNGGEVARSNIDPGVLVNYNTFALNALDEVNFFNYPLDAALLTPGSHTLGVEVHQVNATSSDLSFDLRLNALVGGSTYDGSDAARSGSIRDDQESWMALPVTGPGVLSFQWKVSSELERDWLELIIDGAVADAISGDTAWLGNQVALGAGDHEVKWRYRKDPSGSSGQDSGWVDQITWVPGFGFADWRALHFTAPELQTAAVSGFGADPDADGLTNGIESLLGLDPRMGSPSPVVSAINSSSVTTMMFVIPESGPGDVGAALQTSTGTGGPWSTVASRTDAAWTSIAGAGVTAEPGEPGFITITVTVPSIGNRLFVRLAATYQP